VQAGVQAGVHASAMTKGGGKGSRGSVGGGGSGKFKGPNAKDFDWEHIYENHSDWGNTARQRMKGGSPRNTFFTGLTKEQIQARVQSAWKNRDLVRTQTNLQTGVKRMMYHGVDPVSGQKIELWFNETARIVESAYPIP
jgi:hypothetical protein